MILRTGRLNPLLLRLIYNNLSGKTLKVGSKSLKSRQQSFPPSKNLGLTILEIYRSFLQFETAR